MINVCVDQGSSTFGCIYKMSIGKSALSVLGTGCSPLCNTTVMVNNASTSNVFRNYLIEEQKDEKDKMFSFRLQHVVKASMAQTAVLVQVDTRLHVLDMERSEASSAP